jgi:hypothetical protein
VIQKNKREKRYFMNEFLPEHLIKQIIKTLREEIVAVRIIYKSEDHLRNKHV